MFEVNYQLSFFFFINMTETDKGQERETGERETCKWEKRCVLLE